MPKFKIKDENINFSGTYEECLCWIKDEQANDLDKETEYKQKIKEQ